MTNEQAISVLYDAINCGCAEDYSCAGHRAIEALKTNSRQSDRMREALEKLSKGNRAPGVLQIARAALEVI